MGRTTKYQKTQVKKRRCATSALHGISIPGEHVQLLHARVIRVQLKRELLGRIGKSADHFNGHICTSCIKSVKDCETRKSVSETEEIEVPISCVSEGEMDFDDGNDSGDRIHRWGEVDNEHSPGGMNDIAASSDAPTGTQSESDPVILLSLTNLRHDLDRLSPDIRALIAFELAAGERSKIRSDTVSLTKGEIREINSLQDICNIDYLQQRNKVLSNFVTGLWSSSAPQGANSPLPSGNLKARVQDRRDIYKIAKAIESCMGLTTPVAVLPFHFREVVLLYNHTHSRAAVTLLACSAPHGCYPTIKTWLDKLGQSQDESKIPADKGDILSVFDNNQVLQRRWRICVDNRSVCSVITMVMFVDINPEGKLQFQEELKPSNWMWENLNEQKIAQLKEGHLNADYQDTWYTKHFHPWLTHIIQEVVNEQSIVDGKCSDDVDTEVTRKKQDKNFRTCPACQYSQVGRRKKKCPSCNTLLPSNQQNAPEPNDQAQGQNKASSKGTVRAFVNKKNATTYNITYEKLETRACEYSHLPEQHPTTPPNVTIGEPISLNPCSYDAVAEVFRNIGKQAGIKRYGGTREWLSILCDGLPYILGYQLIERTFVCELCNTSVQGLSERVSHQEEHRKQNPGSNCNYTQEFDWVLLQPGPGHVEMNMLKTFVKFTWPVFWEGMVELFNFRSEIAKKSARSVNDHHKGMALAKIARESFAKELVLPYVRQEMLKENGDLSVAGYLKFAMDTVESPNYALMAELTFGILDAIFLYRAGLRCGDVAMIDAGRAFFARMWCARSHPLYRQIAVYDSIMNACMPAEVREFNNRTKSINTSGDPYTGEGPDFKLEALNRDVQHTVASNPTDKDWKHACANQPKLAKLRRLALEEMGIKDNRQHVPNTELGPQILAFRTSIREREFISDHDQESPLTSYANEPLDKDLVDFAETALAKEQAFLESFIDHKRKGRFLEKASVALQEAPIFVTPEERSDYNSIHNKPVKTCIQIINAKIAEIEDEEMRRNFMAAFEIDIIGKRGKRQDYLDFHDLLEEYEMFASCGVGTEECVTIDNIDTNDAD